MSIKNQIIFGIIKVIFFISFISMDSRALEIRGNITKSVNHINAKDPSFKVIENNEELGRLSDNLKSFSVGGSIFHKGFSLSTTTNRLLNEDVEKTVIHRKTGLEFTNRTKITTDTLNIGYVYKRFLSSFLIANVKMDKKLYYKGKKTKESSQTAIMKGFNFSYFLSKEDMVSAYYLFEEKEFYIKDVIGVGYTRLF